MCKIIFMEKIRIFLAIGLNDIPPISAWVKNLRQLHYGDQLKWTRPNQWHLTVKFIGSFSVEVLPVLTEQLRKAYENGNGGELVITGAGIFGPVRAPKVVWVGVEHASWLEEVNRIAEEVCVDFGVSESQRAFAPHLTLARVRKLKRPVKLLNEVEKHKGTVWHEESIKQVTLYKSDLTPDGPVYSVLEHFKLS